MKWLEDLKRDPAGTVSAWQDMRWPWVLMTSVCVLLVLVAHYVFQDWLYMAPCEQCVYIRFGFLAMALGGLFCIASPKNLACKAIGYALAIYGAVYGFRCSWKLDGIHHAVHSDDPSAMFGMQGCSTDPHYPLGLPLEKWAPGWFKPTGDCGYDLAVVPDGTKLSAAQEWLINLYNSSDSWYLVPPLKFMSMAQCCMLAFGLMLVILVVMAACFLCVRFARKAA